MNCTIDLLKFSYASYSQAADCRNDIQKLRAGVCIIAIADNDTIVTPYLCHAPAGSCKMHRLRR